MTADLIDFPQPDAPGLHSTGEGGQYVMLLVPRPQGFEDACYVEADILATSPDCDATADIWPRSSPALGDAETRAHLTAYLGGQSQARHADEADRRRPWRQWQQYVARARGADDLSVPLLAAIHLGSSGHALWDEGADRLWEASYDDLTLLGTIVYNALTKAFGVEPLLRTFLDT